jgi:hypothetical protein
MKKTLSLSMTIRNLRLASGLLVLISSLHICIGQIVVDLPNVNVLPDTAGQSFDVFIQNSGAARTDVTGIAFQIQTTDGGPSSGGSIVGPSISFVDVITGPVFSGNNSGNEFNAGVTSQIFYQQTDTVDSGGSTTFVSIPTGVSKLATVTISTSGLFTGTYTMTLNTLNGSTKFFTGSGDFGPTQGLQLGDGTISIVPEPNAAAMVGGLLLFVGGFHRWRSRKGQGH